MIEKTYDEAFTPEREKNNITDKTMRQSAEDHGISLRQHEKELKELRRRYNMNKDKSKTAEYLFESAMISPVTDGGYRSLSNIENLPPQTVNIFTGRSSDVTGEKCDFCKSARSAAEGFIAAAKNLRGFGRSLYRGPKGHRIWSLLCQTAYNLKKFLQLYFADKIKEESLTKLGTA